MNQTLKNKGIVLFDGYCNLCSGSVQFVIKRDRKDYFRFVSMQSEDARKILFSYKFSVNENNSVILIENFTAYNKSTAVLRIVKKLNGLWPMLYVLILIPRPIRDFIYMILSRNRFIWFGKKNNCFIPSEKSKLKFL